MFAKRLRRKIRPAAVGVLTSVCVLPALAAGTDFVPFTATRVQEFEDNTGNHLIYVASVAFRSDGSWVEWRQRVNRKPVDLRAVVDVQAGKRTVIDGKTKSITTYELSERQVKGMLESRRGGCDKPLRGTVIEPWHKVAEKISGFEVEKAVVEAKLPPGLGIGEKNRIEIWRAPALGCAELRVITSTIDPKGNVVMRTRRQMTAITPGEPVSALFRIPTDYVERSPGEVFAEAARLEGAGCRGCSVSGSLLDEVYRGSRKHEEE